MKRLRLLALVACLVWCEGLNAQNGLKLGEPVGPVTLLSPQGPAISMNNYAERLGTAVLFNNDGVRPEKDVMNVIHLNRLHGLRVGHWPRTKLVVSAPSKS